MRSNKKVLSAFLASAALVLGISFGLTGSPLALRAEAASDDEQIDMVDLLDAILGEESVLTSTGPDLDPVARATAIYFSEDFEGVNKLTIAGLWHVSAICEVPTGPSANALRYGTSGDCDYDDGTMHTETASTGNISLAGAIAPITLTFNYFLQTEDAPNVDIAKVQVSIDGGTPITVADNEGTVGVVVLTDSMFDGDPWLSATIDLVGGAAMFVPGTDTNVDIQFVFNTVTASNNTFKGFYVDNIVLTADDNKSAGGAGSTGPCFIATAAYGTPMADEIVVLRNFRDAYLLNNAMGTAFVDTYYRASPAIAEVVADHPSAAQAVRLALVPAIVLSRIALASPGIVLAGLLPILLVGARTGRRRLRA